MRMETLPPAPGILAGTRHHRVAGRTEPGRGGPFSLLRGPSGHLGLPLPRRPCGKGRPPPHSDSETPTSNHDSPDVPSLPANAMFRNRGRSQQVPPWREASIRMRLRAIVEISHARVTSGLYLFDGRLRFFSYWAPHIRGGRVNPRRALEGHLPRAALSPASASSWPRVSTSRASLSVPIQTWR